MKLLGAKSKLPSGAGRRTLAVFLATMGVLGVALAWLAWQLIVQDRQLEVQRITDRLEQSADRITASLEPVLVACDRELRGVVDGKPRAAAVGVAVIEAGEHGLKVEPSSALLYLPPEARHEAEPGGDGAKFAEGERIEFQENDPLRAALRYRALAGAANPAVRAAALVRVARCYRKAGMAHEALAAYRELESMKGVAIEGRPAELTAFAGTMSALESLGRRADLEREALRMDAGLRSARWSMAGAVWDLHREVAAKWSAPPLSAGERDRLAQSRAAEWLVRRWPNGLDPQGRRVLRTDAGALPLAWVAEGSRLTAVLLAPERLRTAWQAATMERGVNAVLMDAEGSAILGLRGGGALRAVRTQAAPGWPATLLVTPRDVAAEMAGAALRRRFLLAGFALVGLMLVSGSAFILHSMAREREVVRMQSEFVSAVSHEFRTPLTSLRQMSELLLNDRVPEPERKQTYQFLFDASRRLQRLVESLLDFGRMEAASFRYHFETVDAGSVVARTVAEFTAQVASGRAIETRIASGLPAVRADSEALGVALWNLLDNAVKYSPAGVAVTVACRDGRVTIAVRDEGPGVEVEEHERIFERFVRGRTAHTSQVPGTGLGLSVTRHIVAAHSGEIRVESEAGHGSTFIIELPAETKA